MPELDIVVHYNGWHLEKDGVIGSPQELIEPSYVRKLVMAEAQDICWPLPDGLKVATVHYREADGKESSYNTDINGTRLSITHYFLGQNLNIGTVDDKMVFCFNVEVKPSTLSK